MHAGVWVLLLILSSSKKQGKNEGVWSPLHLCLVSLGVSRPIVGPSIGGPIADARHQDENALDDLHHPEKFRSSVFVRRDTRGGTSMVEVSRQMHGGSGNRELASILNFAHESL